MNTIFADVLAGTEVRIYIDDIVVGTRDFIRHEELLLTVLRRLVKHRFTLSWAKVELFKPEVRFLGCIIGKGTVRPDPDRIRDLLAVRAPTSQKELRSFLGAVQFLGPHLPGLSLVAKPLFAKSSPMRKWTWDSDSQETFDEVKGIIAKAVALTMPRRDRGFVVMTDASGTGLGGILLQRGENQQPALCACISQAFTETERKWSTTEREAYAIVRSLEKFAGMVQGEPIVVVTDHKALTALDTTEQGKLMRWRMKLCEYDVQFQYVEGNSNLVADWLSRLHPDHEHTVDAIAVPVYYTAVTPLLAPGMLKQAQPPLELQALLRQSDHGWYHSRTGAAYIPEPGRKAALNLLHGCAHSGHAGFNRCYRRARGAIWWPTLDQDLRAHIQNALSALSTGPTPVASILRGH